MTSFSTQLIAPEAVMLLASRRKETTPSCAFWCQRERKEGGDDLRTSDQWEALGRRALCYGEKREGAW